MSLSHVGPPRAQTLWRRVAAVALLTALFATPDVVMPDAVQADRDRDAEAWLAAAIGRERIDRGLHRLLTAGDVADVAAAWSARMAGEGQLAHNPSYPDQVCCWTEVSENVATVSGIEARGGLRAALRDVHRLLMGSSDHRANILHPGVNEVGVGVYVADDALWVTQILRHRPDASQPPPPPSASSGGGGDSSAGGGGSSGGGGGSSAGGGGSSGGGAGHPGGGSAGDTGTSQPAFNPDEVQGRLAELGWYAAEVDGVVGPVTREAITGFQGAAGLDADGRIGTETLAALTADDPPHRSGSGGWADRAAAFSAVRQQALEVWGLEAHPSEAVGEEHPVLVVLDRLVAAQGQ